MEERPFKDRMKNRKEENNSALPKAVAEERSSQATAATGQSRALLKLSSYAFSAISG